jgi:hypothetical protein
MLFKLMEILTFLGILFALGLFVKILKNKDKPFEDYENTPENRRKARQDLFSNNGNMDGDGG